MRDKAWYLLMLKGKTKEWAYKFIKRNLEAPSFVYEQQNAYAAYKEVFGEEFASPEELRVKTDKEEIERLKAELEAAKAQKPVYNKEQFYFAHSELKGAAKSKAWAEYAAEKGVAK
jgi:uncharacterized small protein (DUF1192 family)